MNIHRFSFLWKGQFGVMLIGGLVFFAVVGTVLYLKGRTPKNKPTTTQTAEGKEPVSAQASQSTVTTFESDMPVFRRGETKQAPAPVVVKTNSANLPIPLLFFAIPEQPPLGSAYAAFGRFIRCKLFNTVDSNRIQTPIVGIILEDVWSYDGQLIFPAGGEVHGTAQLDNARERIASKENWVVVFVRDGQEIELPITGIACDHQPDPSGGWKIPDGSAGLPGELILADSLGEFKRLLTAALNGAATKYAQDQVQSTITSNGTVVTQNSSGFKQAAAQGIATATQLYVQQSAQAYQRDGFFYRVPAGKHFYVYVTQTIDPSLARAGASMAARANQPIR